MADKKPVWPSAEEQIAAAKATRGSALEQLIRNNQDFQMLAPEEAHDNAGLPLWLRVHWRKAHPELTYPKANPGAGYPDVLHTMYNWMQSHPDLPWGSVSDPARGGKQ